MRPPQTNPSSPPTSPQSNSVPHNPALVSRIVRLGIIISAGARDNMNHMDIEAAIRKYLPQMVHLSLATCVDNKPWVSELHFVYDDSLNLYFRSTKSRRHSQEIAINPFVAGNIVTQHHPGQKVRGVYFEGQAKRLDSVGELHPAYLGYCTRFGTGPAILDEARTEGGHIFYQISVSDFYLFDSYESNPGQKHHLPWHPRSG